MVLSYRQNSQTCSTSRPTGVPAYGLLALLWIFTLRDHGITKHRSMYVAFLVASAYGALTELNQVWIPGRYPSAFDIMFNVAGGLIFIWLYWRVTREVMAKSRGLTRHLALDSGLSAISYSQHSALSTLHSHNTKHSTLKH